jgi:hypothetical protein
MEFILIELLLWGALIFFFWALKDNLGRIDTDIDSLGILGAGTPPEVNRPASYARPEQMSEPIGRYQDFPIYRYAVIDGRRYQFDHVVPNGPVACNNENERCVAPGLIYVAMPDSLTGWRSAQS